MGVSEPKRTALVTVRTRCTCGAERWFYCCCAGVVAEYDVFGFDGVPSCPHPEAVAIIMRAHPGYDLIYTSLGAHYDSLVLQEYEHQCATPRHTGR